MGAVTPKRGGVEAVFEKLEAMGRAARNAFNRHSRADVEELRRLHRELAADLEAALGQAAAAMDRDLLKGLKSIADHLGGLAESLDKKIQGVIMFSDKAVSQSNQLLDQQAGLLRTLLDILKTDNLVLKKYAREEALRLIQNCNDFATEHEARLIEGLCLPQAAPIFLALLEQMRGFAQDILAMVKE